MKPIGLFGGTFDPIHLGHLRPLLDLRDGLPLEEIRIIPCRQPAHRGSPHADPEIRAELVRLSIEGVEGLRLDTRELERVGPSYTVETLESLREALPRVPLCWILGADAFAGLASWHRWQELLDLAHLIVCTRPEAPTPRGRIARLLHDHSVDAPWRLNTEPAGHILNWPVTQLDISSTRIRELAAVGRDLRCLVTEPVRQYIERHSLYRRPEIRDNAMLSTR